MDDTENNLSDSITKDSIPTLKFGTRKLFIVDYFPGITYCADSFECLSKPDIAYMLAEKENRKVFNWDNQLLGFNIDNRDTWYAFSVPMFSEDKTVVVMLVKELCKPFLCGSGYTAIFKKENGVWIYTKVGMHQH
ncbi:MAG: hypothetical protein H7259_02500 [Cytophagales bacterium]|nr:hypothetical protein [Cytophaga sp.]